MLEFVETIDDVLVGALNSFASSNPKIFWGGLAVGGVACGVALVRVLRDTYFHIKSCELAANETGHSLAKNIKIIEISSDGGSVPQGMIEKGAEYAIAQRRYYEGLKKGIRYLPFPG